MHSQKYYNHEVNEILSVSRMPEIEFISPIQRAKDIIFSVSTYGDKEYFTSLLQSLEKKNVDEKTQKLMNQLIDLRASKQWDKFIRRIQMQVLPTSLADLLKGVSKTEQQSILRRISFTTDSFWAFLFEAFEDYGYLYSFYSVEHLSTNLEGQQLPTAACLIDGGVNKFGSTTMSDGQIKQMIEHRHCHFATFIDKGDDWHCFFYTFKSLGGNEMAYKDGQPHMHYISSKWGLSRQQVLKQLRNKRYKLPSFHVDFTV